MSLLEVEGISKRFGGVTAVDGCSLSIELGSITGLIGPNGSGKTTVFNLITGFISQDSGDVRFDGRSISGLGPNRIYALGIGRTFQLARIFPTAPIALMTGVPRNRRAALGVTHARIIEKPFELETLLDAVGSMLAGGGGRGGLP